MWNLGYNVVNPSNFIRVMSIAAVQLALNILVDYICLMIERAQNMPMMKLLREEPYRIFGWALISFIQVILLVLCMLTTASICHPSNP